MEFTLLGAELRRRLASSQSVNGNLHARTIDLSAQLEPLCYVSEYART